MTEDKDRVRVGDGIADNLKQTANQELLDMGKILIGVISKYVKEKIQGINLDELFSKKNEDEFLNLWSSQLAKKELIPQGYAGLPENLLIDNLHQTGYVDGIYIGYILAMMSLVDNDAPENLILSVRDAIRPKLIGHHYNDRGEFCEQYKKERYSWIEQARKEDTLGK